MHSSSVCFLSLSLLVFSFKWRHMTLSLTAKSTSLCALLLIGLPHIPRCHPSSEPTRSREAEFSLLFHFKVHVLKINIEFHVYGPGAWVSEPPLFVIPPPVDKCSASARLWCIPCGLKCNIFSPNSILLSHSSQLKSSLCNTVRSQRQNEAVKRPECELNPGAKGINSSMYDGGEGDQYEEIKKKFGIYSFKSFHSKLCGCET